MRSIEPTWADLVKAHGYYPVENYLRQKGLL